MYLYGEPGSPYKPYKDRGEIKVAVGKGCADELPDMPWPVRVRCTLSLRNSWIGDVRRSVVTKTCPSLIMIQSRNITCYHEANLTEFIVVLHTGSLPTVRLCCSFPFCYATYLTFVFTNLLSRSNFISGTLFVCPPQNQCRKNRSR